MIGGIGHAAFEVTDLDASVKHATTVLGLREVGRGDGWVFLSHGPLQHSLEYREGPVTGLDHVALQARDLAGFEQACARLADAGYELDHEQRPDPVVERNARFRMESGHAVDIFIPSLQTLADYSWQGQPPSVSTGARPRRVGHVNLNFVDAERARDLFTEILGFRVSDVIVTPDGQDLLYFLRCGTAHHAVGAAYSEDGLFHYAFEADTVQDLARLGDALDSVGGQLVWGPGRHGAGDNIATYHVDPSGLLIEVFAEMQLIEDDRWQPRTWRVDDPRLNNVWGASPDVGPLFAASVPVVGASAAVVAQ